MLSVGKSDLLLSITGFPLTCSSASSIFSRSAPQHHRFSTDLLLSIIYFALAQVTCSSASSIFAYDLLLSIIYFALAKGTSSSASSIFMDAMRQRSFRLD